MVRDPLMGLATVLFVAAAVFVVATYGVLFINV